MLTLHSLHSFFRSDVHVLHQLLEIAHANLCFVSATTGQNEQLVEGHEAYVVLVAVSPQNLNNVMLFELDFLFARKLHKICQRKPFDATFAPWSVVAQRTRILVVEFDAETVLDQRIFLLNGVKVINKLFQSCIATFHGSSEVFASGEKFSLRVDYGEGSFVKI